MNSNCLENRACPECGHQYEVLVQALIWTSLTDDGTDHYSDSTKRCTEVAYDEQSPARCPECGYEGRFGEWDITKQ